MTDSQVIPATGHSYGDWSTTKEASCDTTGSREKVCSACGDTIAEEIPALGHAWNENPTIDKAATCTDSGSQSIHCARCDSTKDNETIPLLGHDWSSTPTVEKVATCIEDGTESTHCTRCDVVKEGSEQVIPKTGHKYGAWKTTKAATEIAAGQKTRTCSVCGHAEKQTIAMLKPTLPAVKITTPIAAKKAATIKWKKVSKANQKKIATIQIQYSLDKTFKTGVKTVTAKRTAASKKITKLKSKKTYYVRVRAYKKSGGAVHVSKWSAVKKVKAK
ncbi:MAG: fibronectin type III domain-containing protein [Mogibacterium sp.]|nr:fibronectin type III domain-containing protein [Mogibacterium sp.]